MHASYASLWRRLTLCTLIYARAVFAYAEEARATYSSCSNLVRTFDFRHNHSADLLQHFHDCISSRAEILAGLRPANRPALLAGEDFPMVITPSRQMPPAYWALPLWDYVVSNQVRKHGTFDPGELGIYKMLIAEESIVCDIGANVGAYTVPLAVHVGPKGRIHSFEPFRISFQILMANVALNGISNVYGHQLALGEREQLSIALGPAFQKTSNIGATRVLNQVPPHEEEEHVLQYGAEETVRVVALDSLGLHHIDFIKIDVEGALEQVLNGARSSINKFRPLLAVEHEGKEAPLQLLDWGYRCVLLLPVHDLWICVPRERFWRYPWLDDVKIKGRTLLVNLAPKPTSKMERRRGEASRGSPSVLQNLL